MQDEACHYIFSLAFAVRLDRNDRECTRDADDYGSAQNTARRACGFAARVTRLELDRYFNRNPRADFSRIVLDFSQGTAFEQQVWQLVGAIPRGETRTYGEIARALGRPHAARAVGRCNAKNPWAIVVPCHRLVGSEAQLRGYGGGRLMKQKLLELEGIDLTALRAKRLTAAFPSAPATRGRRRADANRN